MTLGNCFLGLLPVLNAKAMPREVTGKVLPRGTEGAGEPGFPCWTGGLRALVSCCFRGQVITAAHSGMEGAMVIRELH